MKQIFLVLGYGIPKDILKDENYRFYLSIVFNKIYDVVISNKISRPIIIFSGGKTDCHKPFKRNEADEMIRFFKHLGKKPSLKQLVSTWLILSEKKSLSTLENFLLSQVILKKRKIRKANIIIFCEKTRENRVKKLAKKVLGSKYNIKVKSVDFDVSSNRYLPSEFLKEKEKTVLKYDLWALQSPENLKKYHAVFEEKIDFLRKAGPKRHTRALKEWWELKLKELKDS